MLADEILDNNATSFYAAQKAFPLLVDTSFFFALEHVMAAIQWRPEVKPSLPRALQDPLQLPRFRRHGWSGYC
ncbi:hypothetical protein VU12_01770 [Desulfobulbus sp. US4]|nr:hypothetical protein [Desulfobulbus sp. US4]